MKEEAGNCYKKMQLKGLSLAVIATQDTAESDSLGDTYDSEAVNSDQYKNLEKSVKESLPKPILIESTSKQTTLSGDSILTDDIKGNVTQLTMLEFKPGSSLDLNGQTIEATTNNNASRTGTISGAVTVSNGTFILNSTNGTSNLDSLFWVNGGADLTLRDVTITLNAKQGTSAAVYLSGSSKKTLTISNSTVTGISDGGKAYAILAGTNGEVTIEGEKTVINGEISTRYADQTTVTLTISGGDLTNATITKFNKDKVTITGGKFSKDPNTIGTVPSDYKAVQNGDVWTVQPISSNS
jgi:hypothetical protein